MAHFAAKKEGGKDREKEEGKDRKQNIAPRFCRRDLYPPARLHLIAYSAVSSLVD